MRFCVIFVVALLVGLCGFSQALLASKSRILHAAPKVHSAGGVQNGQLFATVPVQVLGGTTSAVQLVKEATKRSTSTKSIFAVFASLFLSMRSRAAAKLERAKMKLGKLSLLYKPAPDSTLPNHATPSSLLLYFHF